MKSKKASVDRRGFFKNAAAGAAALATTGPIAKAQREAGETRPAAAGGAPAPTQQQLARDAGNVRPPAAARAITRAGSDLMVQAIRDLGIEYAAANPGST
ncbi:MAG TPA: twin-arginine translocation signal domain-containing protein, partial [Bryobacteraceae bacterium]|nr:twin-arginine translocation signal domain-containing protein [Bryobacteraceae bacterium]